jgi:hypothetical protein
MMVNGKVLLRNSKLTAFDRERDVLLEARARAADALGRAGIEHRVADPWRR